MSRRRWPRLPANVDRALSMLVGFAVTWTLILVGHRLGWWYWP